MKTQTNIKEAKHTFAEYSFAHYCQEMASIKRKKYFSESFTVADRYSAFGQANHCKGPCEGTGWVPINKDDMSEPWRSLWVHSEKDAKSDDGWHFVPCPDCSSKKLKEGLDEHICKIGNSYNLRSKKSNTSLANFRKELGGIQEDADDDSNSSSTNAEDNPNTELEKKVAQKKKRAKKQAERIKKKLLPYEFDNAKDATRTAGHLGVNGAHISGNGIYKPGSSDFALRDAVARKKAKQALTSGKPVAESAIGFVNFPNILRRIRNAAGE